MFPSGVSGDRQSGSRIMSPARERNTSAKGRVLVVDDEVEIRESLEALLDLEGYQVDLAANAAEGERNLELRAYDLVLLDLMMPEKSGMEMLRDVRARDKHTDKTPPMVARWQKSLQSKKDGNRDVFILEGNASFEDPQTTPSRLLRGDKILVLESGRFAVGWGNSAGRMGVDVEVLPGDMRRAVRPAEVEARLKADKGGTIPGGGWVINAANGLDCNGQYPATVPAGAPLGTDGTGQIYSFHTTGTNALMADGSVRLLDADPVSGVAPAVLAALITRAGGEAYAAGSF